MATSHFNSTTKLNAIFNLTNVLLYARLKFFTMDYVIQALTYDLSCHSEDFSIADQNLKRAMKEKRNDDAELYQKEKIQLSKNMKQIRKAIKILNGL